MIDATKKQSTLTEPKPTCRYFLEQTTKSLGFDIDSYQYEYRKLMSILNARYLAEQTNSSFVLNEKNGGYHISIGIPSSLELRGLFQDDKKRMLSAEIRTRFGMPAADIRFRWKVDFCIRKIRGRKRYLMKKKPVPYEECSLEKALSLPFWTRCDANAKL